MARPSQTGSCVTYMKPFVNRSEFVLCVIVNPCRLHLFLCRLQTTFFRETLFAIRMTLYNIVFAAYYFLVCSYVLFGLMNRNELTPRCFSGMIRPSYNCIFDEWYQATREPGKRTFAGSWSHQSWVWVNKHNHVTRAIVNHPFQITINGLYKPSIHPCGLSHCFTNII